MLKEGTGIGSLIFGKPMLNNGVAVGRKIGGLGLLPSTDPKILIS